MKPQFDIGDKVWFVQSGNGSRYVTCPDCFGQCALTVILGDGSQVSIECDCCKEGFAGSRGQVKVYDWHCAPVSAVITGMEIDCQQVRYKFSNYYVPNDGLVFATKEEAELEAIKVLAEHEADEAHRFAHVKDRQVRHRTWAFSVSYHRNNAKRAKRDLEYHESRIAVAKTKAKTKEAE
jgi:hypothetical protein